MNIERMENKDERAKLQQEPSLIGKVKPVVYLAVAYAGIGAGLVGLASGIDYGFKTAGIDIGRDSYDCEKKKTPQEVQDCLDNRPIIVPGGPSIW